MEGMRRFGVHSLRSRAWLLGIVLTAASIAAGCKKTTNVAITMTPTTATVLVGTATQFTATSSNGGAVNWSVNGVANGNTTVGTVSTNGLYTAPLSIPNTSTVTSISVTATLQSDSSIAASATITLDSGVRVDITPTSFTLGTQETLPFSAIVTGVPLQASRQPNGATGDLGCNAISAPPSSVPYCNTVTWTVTPAQTLPAGIDSTSGLFTAPSSPTSVVVTATSVFDTTRTGTASVSILQATPPTLSSVSPNNAARGSLLQDVYLTGANFLSTTNVFVNGTKIPGSNILVPQPGLTTQTGATVGTLIHIRLSDLILATPPVPPATSTTLTFSVGQQGSSTQIPCNNANPALCQFSLVPVRPAVVGTSPDSIPQGTGSPVAFSVNGGFFGTAQNPTVTAFYNGNEAKFPTVSSTNSTRQLTVTIGGSGNANDVSTPGLFPVAITSNANPGASVVTNIAVQPSYPASSIGQLVQFSNSATGGNVGTAPSSVAIDTATGVAVVANQGANDVELIDLTKSTPAVIGFICTADTTHGASISPTETGACPASGPASVAVDNVAGVALVANSAISNVALLDLNAQKVLQTLPMPNNNSLTTPAPFVPVAVGINPLNHIGIVAYQSTNAASLLTVTPGAPTPLAFSGVVNVSTGPNPRVSVSQRLDWALVTPGGLGSFGIVDLARQTTNAITSASRTSGIVTITTTTAQNVQVGTPVLISGVGDNSFDGVYQVQTIPSSTTFTYSQTNILNLSNATTSGGAVSYGFPVATLATSTTVQGVAFNDQTQKAILTDPAGSTPGSVFAALDQTSTTIPLPTTNQGDTNFNLATAVNPLANLAVSVNQHTGDFFVIDPNAPSVLKTMPAEGVNPVDVAIDPGTNIAVFANQGSSSTSSSVGSSVSIYSLGAIRPLQILQASVAPTPNPAPEQPPTQPCPTATGPIVGGASILVCSTFASGTSASAADQTVTIIGSGFTPTSKVRLDGQVLQTNPVSSRELTAIVTKGFQSVPRRYSLDVADSGNVSNSTSLAVVQSVDLTQGNGCLTAPQGVAVDPQLNEAVVTDSGLGCKQVYLINLGTGAIQPVDVGTNPQGVAVSPRLNVAVVANQGDNTASVIDETTASTAGTATLDNGPTGVAIDEDLGQAVVTATAANVADQFSVTRTNGVVPPPGTSSSLSTQQGPTAVAVDSVTHFAAVGNATSGDVTVLSLSSSSTSNTTSSIQIPQGIAVDPCPASACNANEEFLPNPNFLITASLQNQVEALDPTTGVLTPLRVGINPTALAYNPQTSTLVTVNTLSQTMTVVDYLSKLVRAVFPVTPSNRFGVAIMPQTNLAVVADPTNSRVLLFPLPY